MFVAEWNGVELAKHSSAMSLEGALYFPPNAVRADLLQPSSETSFCEWKGAHAEYFDVCAGDEVNSGAAWRYPKLGPALGVISGWYSFWRGIDVQWIGEGTADVTELGFDMPNVAKAVGATEVEWRGQPPFLDSSTVFSGYLIPEFRIAVDVLADPGPERRGEVIVQARERALQCVRYSDQQRQVGKPGASYIAVWGSTPPSSGAVETLLGQGSVLELESTSEHFR